MENIQVIIERLDNLKEDNAQEHEQIIAQVTKINGSVADIQKWRWMLTGGFIISNIIIVPIIVALILKFF